MQKYFLKRKKISDALHHIYEYPMTLAVAAMGYGKSTATRDFLEESKAKYVWLSVESDESSPKYIWDVFARKLSKFKPEIGEKLRLLGFPMDTPQKEKVLRIIEEHNFGNNIIVVIDDYHFVHSPEMDQFFEYLVNSKIERLHILILTRTVPQIAIDEFILKGFCHLISSELFEMSIDEIIDFFSLCGYDVTKDMAQKVYDLSEGCVSAVYLLLKSYEEIGEFGSGSSIERLIET
ncbi:MAG: hypothetical protein PF505_08895, partial [Vallitaleaceae bacterium]|nr:hypothetical protein [Vallitaleaceae bacterium]